MKNIFLLLFFISGFSGLIYESIWAHYLKLFLGHSAYAQTLVLAIYMGGMALGAALCSRFSLRWRNLLLAYAIAEGVIGLFALFFHPLYDTLTQFTFTTLLPSLENPTLALVSKWTLAALLILPQSILLGMTFPLMSGGLLRRFPDRPGATLSLLYFTNSLGAAIGVLVSAFVLVQKVGLPGTVMTAGIINIVLALIVWVLLTLKPATSVELSSTTKNLIQADSGLPWLLLLLFTAFFTGLASFLYEIGWIRMLSLVLGSSTHSFELMLSTFILGLALGGLWVRRYADTQQQPLQLLGLIQIWMGILALGSLIAYGFMFDAMGSILSLLQKTEQGYSAFLFCSAVLSLALMLPTTFCAGMTLPLITKVLLAKGHGEKSIGAVYASNTLGALIGIFVAIHLAMPLLGLKGIISLGATIDILLGLLLLGIAPKKLYKPAFVGIFCLSIGILVGIQQKVDLDLRKLISGVFRYGRTSIAKEASIVFYQDGKTSSVSIIRNANELSLSNNGKVDATIEMDPKRPATPDEPTMILLGALPLFVHANPQTAAVIGLGSGLTTHTLLTSPTFSRVDTIEIEAAVVEASRYFLPKVTLAYKDPRSTIHIEDAKSFFSVQNFKYDIIVSEPPNPWVSGVANLFTKEFYQTAGRYLNKNGLFVQWLHLYEIDLRLVAVVFNAMESNFSDYRVFSANGHDIVIVSVKKGQLPSFTNKAFQAPLLAKQLQVIGINSLEDLNLHELANKTTLAPLFKFISLGANSDYFPILDNLAPKARFLRSSAASLAYLRDYAVPVVAILQGEGFGQTHILNKPGPFVRRFYRAPLIERAQALKNYFTGQKLLENTKRDIRQHVLLTNMLTTNCANTDLEIWFDSLHYLIVRMLPYLTPEEMDQVWQQLETEKCLAKTSKTVPYLSWIALYQAIAWRDIPLMAKHGTKVLENNVALDSVNHVRFALSAAMLGEYKSGRSTQAQALWQKWKTRAGTPGPAQMLLLSHIYSKANKLVVPQLGDDTIAVPQ